MAFLDMKYFSDTLRVGVSLNVILPEKAKNLIGMKTEAQNTYKTLYLLHGLSDDHTTWMRRTSIERYASERGIAVVMPSVGRSWYVDTPSGGKYFSFVADELPNVCRSFFRGMSDKKEDNFIAGLSMGGYGAVKAALCRPDVFGGCASLSGALSFANEDDKRSMSIIADEVDWLFGANPSPADVKKHDVFEITKNNLENGVPFPKMYLWCGHDDFLLQANRRYDALLNELDIEHVYKESEGNHSWKWWDLHIQDTLDFLLKD